MHQAFLDEAYLQAVEAFEKHEVPVGCVIVSNNIIISRSHNMTNNLSTPLAHAELNALNKIDYKNKDLVFYITCEPCVMCLGILERLNCTVFYGCKNEIFGGTSIVKQNKTFLNNLKDERCFKILQKFYKRENLNAPKEFRIRKNHEKFLNLTKSEKLLNMKKIEKFKKYNRKELNTIEKK